MEKHHLLPPTPISPCHDLVDLPVSHFSSPPLPTLIPSTGQTDTYHSPYIPGYFFTHLCHGFHFTTPKMSAFFSPPHVYLSFIFSAKVMNFMKHFLELFWPSHGLLSLGSYCAQAIPASMTGCAGMCLSSCYPIMYVPLKEKLYLIHLCISRTKNFLMLGR